MSNGSQRGRMSAGTAILLGIIGLLFFALFFRGCGSSTHHGLGLWGPGGWLFPTQLYSLVGVWGLINLALAVWVFFDSDRKGGAGVLWALLVLFTGLVGVVVYLLASPSLNQRNGGAATSAFVDPARPAAPPPAAAPPPPAAGRCVSCGGEVESDFKVCPFCGTSLRCAQCDKPIQGSWKVCPHCAAPIASTD
jgi:RNA polymerase subunit RPABC4/transcription elongation factor Spt4